jgi:hypothetical protein
MKLLELVILFNLIYSYFEWTKSQMCNRGFCKFAKEFQKDQWEWLTWIIIIILILV